MPVDQNQLLAAIDEARAHSYGAKETSSLSTKRAAAIEAYLGLNTNPAPPGRSQVVDRTVYQTISTITPSLTRIFASSSDDICKALPIGPGDELGAELTTAVLTHYVTRQNPWEQIIGDWIADAMLSPNGYAFAYWDKSERMVRERYEDQSEDQLAALLQDQNIRVLAHSSKPDQQGMADAQAEYQRAMQQWQMMAAQAQGAGQPPSPQPNPPQPMTLHDIEIERLENEGKVCIEILPPENCRVSLETPDWTLKRCPYFEFSKEMPIYKLREMGFDVPDDINDDPDDDDSDESTARDRFDEEQGDPDYSAEMKRVNARMIWVEASAENDGISRLYYAVAIGRRFFHIEPVSRMPVVSMVAKALPHRHPGMSVAETIIDIQNVKTAIKRGALDNLYLANNARHLISNKVSLADYLDSRPGGAVRMTDGSLPGEGHVVPLSHQFAFDAIIGSLEYFDQEGQNRTGASRYFSGTDAGAINKTASGTMALQNMASMRVEDIARQMAPAVEELFEIVQELVAKHRNKELAISLKGKWTTIDPQAWRKKRDVRIAVGVGAGNKDSMMQQLGNIYGAQLQLAPMGLAGPDQIHATVTEMAKLAGFSNPDRFWVDPSITQIPAPPPSPEQIKAQAEAQKIQFQAQQDQMKFQAEQALERERMTMQAEVDRQREEMQARQKALEADQAASIERMKAEYQDQSERRRMEFDKWRAELDAAVKLQLSSMSADQSLKVEDVRRKPDDRVDKVIEAMQALQAEASMPAEFVRGSDGRIAEIKRGQTVRKVVRGPDGRPVGLQ